MINSLQHVVICYGDQLGYHHGAKYQILRGYLPWYQFGEVCVVTDKPELFKNYPVRLLHLNAEKLNDWSLGGNNHFGIKLKGLIWAMQTSESSASEAVSSPKFLLRGSAFLSNLPRRRRFAGGIAPWRPTNRTSLSLSSLLPPVRSTKALLLLRFAIVLCFMVRAECQSPPGIGGEAKFLGHWYGPFSFKKEAIDYLFKIYLFIYLSTMRGISSSLARSPSSCRSQTTTIPHSKRRLLKQ